MKRARPLLLSASLLGCALSSAYATDLDVKSAYDWSGFYFGARLGAGSSGYSGIYDNADAVGPANLSKLDNTGFALGGYAGYNYMWDAILFGVEGDIGTIFGRKSFLGPEPAPRGPDKISIKSTYLASLRMRTGATFDRVLLYATGGVGFTGNKMRISDALTATTGKQTFHRTGWVLGAGVEYAFTDQWIMRAEFLHYDFSKKKSLSAAFTDSDAGDFLKTKNVNIFSVGISFKF